MCLSRQNVPSTQPDTGQRSVGAARLKNQLTTILEDIRSKNQKFQEDVSTKLATLITKHQEEMRSTTHGPEL